MSHFSTVECQISSKYKNTVINALKVRYGAEFQVYQVPTVMATNYGGSYAEQDINTPVDCYITQQGIEGIHKRDVLNPIGFNFSGKTMEIVADNYETSRFMGDIKSYLGQAVIAQIATEKGFCISDSVLNSDGTTTLKLTKKQLNITL